MMTPCPTERSRNPVCGRSRRVGPRNPDRDAGPGANGAADGGALRFLSYNLKNYLTMTRYYDGKRTESSKRRRSGKRSCASW